MVILQLIFNEDPKDTCLSTVEVVEPLGGFWAQVQGDIFYFPRFQRCGSLSPPAAAIPGVPGLLSHILPFFKTVLKIQLAQIKKCSKNWSLHPWKTLPALPSSCWIFPGCGRWRS